MQIFLQIFLKFSLIVIFTQQMAGLIFLHVFQDRMVYYKQKK